MVPTIFNDQKQGLPFLGGSAAQGPRFDFQSLIDRINKGFAKEPEPAEETSPVIVEAPAI